MKTQIRYFDKREPETYASLSGYRALIEQFAGNLGIYRPKYIELELIYLDDFDKEYYAEEIAKLKPTERIFRYETPTTRIGKLRPLVKVNIEKGLVYYNDVDWDEDTVRFETRGTKVNFLNIVE